MITDKEFRKLIDEAPYLLDSTMLPVTRSAAMKAYAENPVSLEEFVAGIKTKLPKCAWKEYDDALVRIKQQGDLRTASQETDDLLFSAHTKQPIFSSLKKHSRLAVAAVLIIATVSFFTLAPAGRALALEIAGFVERLLGNRLEVSVNSRPGEIDTDMQEYTLVFSSFDELPELGIALFKIDSAAFSVESIEYALTLVDKSLHTEYIYCENDIVYVTQYWDQIDNIAFIANRDFEILHWKEAPVYVAKDTYDGLIDAYIILSNSIVQITTTNTNAISDILSSK